MDDFSEKKNYKRIEHQHFETIQVPIRRLVNFRCSNPVTTSFKLIRYCLERYLYPELIASLYGI